MLLPAPPLRLRKPRANQFRVPRRRPAPVGELTLVSATYDGGGGGVALVFDRAVDASGMDPTTVIVKDGEFVGFVYAGTGTVDPPPSPAEVDVVLSGVVEYSGEGVTLTVGADNGIVAVGDGGTWAGVTDLALPYP